MTHLETAMKTRGFDTNEGLAKKLTIPASVIADIRSGRLTPSPRLLKKLCQLLSVRTDHLVLLDKALFERISDPTTNDQAPGGSLASPATIQTPVESVEHDTVSRMLDPEEQRRATEFAERVLARRLNGREISKELRQSLLSNFRSLFWFDYSPEEAMGSLELQFEHEVAEDIARQAAHAEPNVTEAEPNAESAQVEAAPIEIRPMADSRVDEPVEIPAVIDAEVYYTPDLDRPVRLPALQDMPLEPDKAA